MIDITHKINTLRVAVAQAVVKVSQGATIEAIKNKIVPKGDVLEMAKAAGLLGVKKTPDLIPDCHPLPVEYTGISYEIEGLEIRIRVEVKTIYRTGVEVEAMHGASVVALTMYDMLKPIDKGISIEQIKLLHKKGGKSDYQKTADEAIDAAVLVCSDSISAGEGTDKAGKVIIEKLESFGVSIKDYSVIPDDLEKIRDKVSEFSASDTSIIMLTGGTGLSPRDVTPEAILPLLDKQIPGMEEAARDYGQSRTPYAMLSRSVVGLVGESLVIALPGSSNAVRECMEVLFPYALHLFHILKGGKH